ncbi:MAG: MBL fold metallo-hydrolase [Acidimicrobiales bacterium]
MTTSVIVTGTGTPIPSPDRAGPGVLVRADGLALQFDAGRGAVQRLAGAGLWPTDLDAVFLTHHHSDHLTGLQDLVLTRWIMDRDDAVAALPIVSPAGPTARFVERMLDVWDDDVAVRLEHNPRARGPEVEALEFEVPDVPAAVWTARDVVVVAGRVRHEPVEPAVGYRVQTPDGVIAISGDTLVCDEVAALATGADVLVHEAMRFEHFAGMGPERTFVLDYHADTRLIGAQAREIGVSTLVLTHLIPEPRTPEEVAAFVADIRSGGFEGEVVVAEDLTTVSLPASRRESAPASADAGDRRS